MSAKRYRLLTKGDIDGMVCGMLLKELDLVESAVFVHPKDIESGKIAVTGEDITAGLPYREDAYLAFDHYPSAAKSAESEGNLKVDFDAPSTSRVIYNHYGKDKFVDIHEDVLDAVDKGFGAKIASDEILYPTGWMLLSYLIDQRTGLEGFRTFRVAHDDLINELMDECRRRSIWEILSLPDVEQRLNTYFACIEEYKDQLLRCSSVHSNLVVTDTRKETLIYPGNKFMTYALFPECNVSLHVYSAAQGGRTVFAAGRSVLDRTCSLDVGRIMKKYGGGGHAGAGAFQADAGRAKEIKECIIKDLRYGFFKNMIMGYYNYY